jgi:pilus assembly protein CpaB
MFIAIALAAGAFFTTMHFTAPKETETGNPVVKPQIAYRDAPSVNIYTARRDIPVGAAITQDMLDIQPWPQHLLLPDMVQADPNQATEIVKMVARTPFAKGEPIIMNKLANIKDPSFLAGALPKGMRVETIPVDAVTGVAGFIYPGDHVDVLVTHDIAVTRADKLGAPPKDPGAIKKDQVTEVLLSNVIVLAINQKATAHGGEPPTVPNTVSLEVSAGDAQKLRLVENGNGRLSLTLRSLKDQDEMALPRPTGVGDLSRLTPPSYFPMLYDAAGHADSDQQKPEEDTKSSGSVTVVRGVKAESVEVSQP